MHAQTHAHARERENWDAIHLVTSINRQSRNSFDYGIILPMCVCVCKHTSVSMYSPPPSNCQKEHDHSSQDMGSIWQIPDFWGDKN